MSSPLFFVVIFFLVQILSVIYEKTLDSSEFHTQIERAQDAKGLTCLRDLPACCRAVIPDKHLKSCSFQFVVYFKLVGGRKKSIEQFCQCNTKMQRLAP